MNGDTWVGAGRAAWDRHLDRGVAPVAQLEEPRRRAVREDRAGAAGEHGGHVEAFALEERFGDEGVDGVVDAVVAAGGGALVDGVVGQPELA